MIKNKLIYIIQITSLRIHWWKDNRDLSSECNWVCALESKLLKLLGVKNGEN